jgi:hypothetical protein
MILAYTFSVSFAQWSHDRLPIVLHALSVCQLRKAAPLRALDVTQQCRHALVPICTMSAESPRESLPVVMYRSETIRPGYLAASKNFPLLVLPC